MRPAFAQQDVVWVQIEAQPNVTAAQQAAERYASTLPDVAAFALGGGWYGVVLGPYARGDAEQVLRSYRAQRRIPGDSYIQTSARLRTQIWPRGEDVLGRGLQTSPLQQSLTASTTTDVTPEAADETPRQARQSEALLTRRERDALQVALRWAGVYNAAIDGAFGQGTRRAMAAWQRDQGFEPTGVLTTAQRR